MAHVHTVVHTSGPLPFFAPVSILFQDRRAHGGYSQIETCSCGCVRESNHNQGAEEVGPWFEPAVLAEARTAVASNVRRSPADPWHRPGRRDSYRDSAELVAAFARGARSRDDGRPEPPPPAPPPMYERLTPARAARNAELIARLHAAATAKALP